MDIQPLKQPRDEAHRGTPTNSHDAARDAETKTAGGVTPRVVALCLTLGATFGYVIPVIDYKLSNTNLGGAHLPVGAVAVLLALLLLNPVLRLFSRRLVFSRNEMLTVYVTCLFSALIPGHGAENFFVSTIIGPFYFATPENKWLQFLEPYLRPWMTPALTSDGHYNHSLVEAWYAGLRPGETIPWALWLLPLLAWGAFIVATYVMVGCLSVMLRAQWGEKEALAFPLLRLPLEMTADEGGGTRSSGFFRNPVMWVGFGIAASIQALNGLHSYFPEVPAIVLNLDSGALFSESPWNQIGWTPLRLYPIAIGIAYLLTSEVSFSLWFFYWLMKLQLLLASYAGFMPNSLPDAVGFTAGGKVFNGYQQVGAYLVYVAFVLWMARSHFAHIARRAFGLAASTREERGEALSYPLAFWGFILSFAFVVAWSVMAGMSLAVALTVWATYLIIVIALTRVVVEGGLLLVLHSWIPLAILGQTLGSGPGTWLAPASAVPAALVQSVMIDYSRGILMPSFVQGFKLAHDRKINAKPLLALIFAVILTTLTVSLWMNVKLGYDNGGLGLNWWFAKEGPKAAAAHAHDLMQPARDSGWANWLWMGLGGIITYGILLARARFLWFPLHPIGFLMSLTWPLHLLWASILVGWACKVLIVRFSGSDGYRNLTPAFLGLVLGDVSMMLFWLAIDGWQGRTGHILTPGQ